MATLRQNKINNKKSNNNKIKVMAHLKTIDIFFNIILFIGYITYNI